MDDRGSQKKNGLSILYVRFRMAQGVYQATTGRTFNSLCEILTPTVVASLVELDAFNSLCEIHKLSSPLCPQLQGLSILYVRFSSQHNRESQRIRDFQFSMWDSRNISRLLCLRPGFNFQFSMWDSPYWPVCPTSPSTGFQFSMWDSYKNRGYVTENRGIAFNSLCEILQPFSLSSFGSLTAFNSLCEIPDKLKPPKSLPKSFNSLCEIREVVWWRSQHSILSFNSLCEIRLLG